MPTLRSITKSPPGDEIKVKKKETKRKKNTNPKRIAKIDGEGRNLHSEIDRNRGKSKGRCRNVGKKEKEKKGRKKGKRIRRRTLV